MLPAFTTCCLQLPHIAYIHRSQPLIAINCFHLPLTSFIFHTLPTFTASSLQLPFADFICHSLPPFTCTIYHSLHSFSASCLHFHLVHLASFISNWQPSFTTDCLYFPASCPILPPTAFICCTAHCLYLSLSFICCSFPSSGFNFICILSIRISPHFMVFLFRISLTFFFTVLHFFSHLLIGGF